MRGESGEGGKYTFPRRGMPSLGPLGRPRDNIESGSPDRATVPPWVKQYRLTSLLEIVERFEPQVLLTLAGMLEVWVQPTDTSKPTPKAFIKDARKTLAFLSNECKDLGLTQTLKTVNRAAKHLSTPTPSYGEFQAICSEIIGRLYDELEEVHLMALTAKEANYYAEWWEGWVEEVMEKFPSAITDIEEASKCLACNRGTATVFHLMRVMELGLQVTAKALGIPYAPSWESYLGQIKTKLDANWKEKSPEWKEEEPFFREVHSFLHAVKLAWRNPTMHIVKHYTPEMAEDVYNAVRGFMRHLATRLSEPESESES